MKTRKNCLDLRNQYLPDDLRYIFITESPHPSEFFYDEFGEKTEPFFAAMMSFLEFSADKKRDGLEHFQECGYLLMYATYQPVNDIKNPREKKRKLLDDLDFLLKDLSSVNPNKESPLILVKKDVCVMLEAVLKQEGYNVLNDCEIVPFPVPYQRNQFQAAISKFNLAKQPHE